MGDKNKGKHHIDRLYECRDMEIRNLWQRSIFLATFLALCITGYGTIIGKTVSCLNCDMKLEYLNSLALLISLIGIIMSTLWIAMAKGSKAWFEVYERAIITYEKKHRAELGLQEEDLMGAYGVPNKDINNCLLSTKSGAFSPSKINIAIGQISLLIWGYVLIWHIILAVYYIVKRNATNENPFGWDIRCSFLIYVLIAIILVSILVYHLAYNPHYKMKGAENKKRKGENILSIKSSHLSQNYFNQDGLKIMEKAEKPESE